MPTTSPLRVELPSSSPSAPPPDDGTAPSASASSIADGSDESATSTSSHQEAAHPHPHPRSGSCSDDGTQTKERGEHGPVVKVHLDDTPSPTVADTAAAASTPSPHASLPPCPEESASWLSFTYLLWLNPLFALGAHKTVDESDIWRVRSDVSAAHIGQLFEEKWAIEKRRWDAEEAAKNEADNVDAANDANSPRRQTAAVNLNFSPSDSISFSNYRLLYRTLNAMYGRSFWGAGLFKCGYDACNFAQPMLLSILVSHITNRQSSDPAVVPPAWHGYALAVGMLLVGLLGVTMLNLFQRICYGIGLRCRTALITALYRKSFRLSPAARAQMGNGQLVNMMSVDASMVDLACDWLHYFWSAFVQMIVATALLINALGAPALVGMGIMLLFVPLQTLVIQSLRVARRSALRYTDQRIRMLSEILAGIRVIKVYAWESSFMQQLSALRLNEMKFVRAAAFIRGRNAVTTQLGPVLMSLGSFMVLGATTDSLQADSVFSSVVLFNLLRLPLLQIPKVLNFLADAQIGLQRIQKFLLAEELTETTERLTPDEAQAATEEDRRTMEDGTVDPALREAYESLMRDCNSPLSPQQRAKRFAIKIDAAEFSWGSETQTNPAEGAAAGAAPRPKEDKEGPTIEIEPDVDESDLGGDATDHPVSPSLDIPSPSFLVHADADREDAARHAAFRAIRNRPLGAASPLDITADVIPASPVSMEDRVSEVAVDEDGESNASSALSDITLLIPAGKLTVICGSVGAGKSSLLCGLLGEMKTVRGSVQIGGRVGYCAQQAWIQNATVRDNILFGRAFDQKRYDETIRVCALTRDLKVLPDGDRTEIGEKGINLSGGQRQRVNLARAYYFDSDIILMDDPLSAVDAHVSKFLFHECIQGAMAGKTRVLVTHQLQYIPNADAVIFLKNGRVHETGTYESLMANDGEFAQLFRAHGGGDQRSEQAEDPSEEDADDDEQPQPGVDETDEASSGAPKSDAAAPITLMTKEERAQGGLGSSTWWYYLEAFGGVGWVSLILLSVCAQTGIRTFNDWWLSSWTDDTYHRSNTFYITIYGGLGCGLCLALFTNVMLMAHRGCVAARVMHERFFASLIRAPMSFFDTTPAGRVLNRASRDQDVLDNSIADSLRMLCFLGTNILAVLVMMVYVQPIFAAALGPIVYLYYHYQHVYRRVNREVKRMDSTSRSPLFAHFSETLTGLPTIRAYGQQKAFVQVNCDRMDENNRFYFLVAASQRWLGTRLESLGALIVFSTAIIAATNGSIDPGLAGLSLSYANNVTSTLSLFLRQSVESENYMNSVERCKYYTHHISSEAPPTVPGDDAPELTKAAWPSRGNIEFEKVSLRYREGLKLVLHSVDISIRGGERVGIVGRTGAGKSSLLVALYRLVEVCGGRILIDGHDIAHLGLDKVRRAMALIPQDPVLFAGTVRTNLDPFNEYSDEEVWDVLKKAHLYDHIAQLDGQLQSKVAESGDNFSVGQKCQICLARAMLKNAKILIMDEATASVDMETDALIQHSLRTHFRSCTILTIAHRLATIMDYDHALVLDFGEVKEFDSPANLLRRGESPATKDDAIFASLVEETGPQTSAVLKKIAFDTEMLRARREYEFGDESDARSMTAAAVDLMELERSVWRNPKIMAESSVSRRAPSHSVRTALRVHPVAVAAEPLGGFEPSGLDPDDEQADELSRLHYYEGREDDDDPTAGFDEAHASEADRRVENARDLHMRVQIE